MQKIMEIKNHCDWAVITIYNTKNNGVMEKNIKIIATFDYPFLAQDFIDKCLPVENRERFRVVPMK